MLSFEVVQLIKGKWYCYYALYTMIYFKVKSCELTTLDRYKINFHESFMILNNKVLKNSADNIIIRRHKRVSPIKESRINEIKAGLL